MISLADVTGMDINRGRNIIGDDAFFFQSGLHVICKFFGVVDMVDGITSHGFYNSGHFVGYSICHRPSAWYSGHQGIVLMFIGKPI